MGEMPPAQVTLATVATQRLVEWEEFTGRVEATETVDLRPRLSGYITEVRFEAGALVKEGDVLAQLDDTEALADLERQREAVARADSEYAAAQGKSRTLEIDTLPDQFRFTEIDLDRARLDLDLAESEWQTAKKLKEDGIVSDAELRRLRLCTTLTNEILRLCL